MPSVRPRVVTYVSKRVLNRLEEFRSDNELKSISEAAHFALEDYFGVGLSSRSSEPSVENLKREIITLKKHVRKLQADSQVIIEPVQVQEQGGCSQGFLSDRLGVSASTITKYKHLASFSEWSKTKDPQGSAWIYSPETQRFYPANETSTGP